MSSMDRRSMMKRVGAAGVGAAAGLGARLRAEEAKVSEGAKLKGNIRHSVSKWCYGKIPLDDLCKHCVRLGITSIELIGPNEWPALKPYGLICAMTPSHGIEKGFNRRENHAECIRAVKKSIDATAEAGFPNVICFSGNREGLDDATGLKNCVEGLKQVIGYAEQKNVNLVMELLNSKRNHKDYQCDHTAWGVEVCKQVGSPRMKLLYDIYHMQIMEGDVIDTIKEYGSYFAHIHTGGVPGRNEIDDTQELNYPAIMKAIVATGYKGFVGQEFVPRRPDPIASLEQAIRICDV